MLLSSSSSSGTGTSVVFLLARGQKGLESLTPLAPQLSRVAQLPPSHVYSHVAGVQSGAYLQKLQHESSSSLVVSLDEWSNKMNNTINSIVEETVVVDAASGISSSTLPSKTQIKQTKRAQQLERAKTLIVDVDANVDPDRLDAAVAAAVQHSRIIERVVLTAVRGVDEVKRERVLLEQRRLQKMHQAAGRQNNNRHRRLEQEEEAQGDDANGNNNNDNNSDMEGVYYVSLTPNILAGILFFFMFATVTWTGISCMGMIQGQEIYVHKMPTIGREA